MISIIVPAFNAELFLARTLDSVLAQTCSAWELIIVNDGSQDATQEIAEVYARRNAQVRVLTTPNAGCASARNRGYAESNPNFAYILFLDHDDVWERDALQTLVRALEAFPTAVAAVGAARVLDDAAVQPERCRSHPKYSLLTLNDLLSFCPIWTMGQVLVRRAAFEVAGLMDAECAPSDDWDLYLRLALSGSFVASEAVIIHWRRHATNTSNDTQRMRQAEERVRAKLLARADLSAEQRQLITRCFQNSGRNLSRSQFRWAWECLSRKEFGEAFRQMGRALTNYFRAPGRRAL